MEDIGQHRNYLILNKEIHCHWCKYFAQYVKQYIDKRALYRS